MMRSRSKSSPAKLSRLLIGAMSCLILCVVSSTGLAQSNDEIRALRKQLQRSNQLIQQLHGRVKELEQREDGSGGASASDEARLEAIEDVLMDLDERVGSRGVVHLFDGMSLDIGGFLTQSFTAVHGDSSTESSFNATQFELLIKAQVTNNLSLFGALGWLREADLDFSDPQNPFFRNFANRTPGIIFWGNYQHNDAFNIRAGRWVTPHGIINVEHFPPVLLETNQPQFLRPFPGATMFPNFMDGVNFHGKFFVGDQGRDVFSYDAYVGQFTGGASKDYIGGGRIGYQFGDSGWTIGGNYSHGRRTARASVPFTPGHFTIVPANNLTSNSYDLVGLDVLYDKGSILWKNEVFYSFEYGEDNRLAFYTQPAIRLNDEWLMFYRFDYLDPGQNLGKSTEHAVGINYLPVPNLRIRAVYFLKNFDLTEDEAGVFQLSATLSF